MILNRPVFFIILAVVLFLVGLVLILTDSNNAKVVQALLFGGLASFAAAHMP